MTAPPLAKVAAEADNERRRARERDPVFFGIRSRIDPDGKLPFAERLRRAEAAR